MLAASLDGISRSLRPLYGCIAALRNHCAALPLANGSSGEACTISLPMELQLCLPGALVVYTSSCTAQDGLSVLQSRDRGMEGAREGPSHGVLEVAQMQLGDYPDSIVYDLLAYQPALVEPFLRALIDFACSSSSSSLPVVGGEGCIVLLSPSSEERLLLGLLIAQKLVQNEKLRAALLLHTISLQRLVSVLTDNAGGAGMLSGSGVATARQKLLSLLEIHFGAT